MLQTLGTAKSIQQSLQRPLFAPTPQLLSCSVLSHAFRARGQRSDGTWLSVTSAVRRFDRKSSRDDWGYLVSPPSRFEAWRRPNNDLPPCYLNGKIIPTSARRGGHSIRHGLETYTAVLDEDCPNVRLRNKGLDLATRRRYESVGEDRYIGCAFLINISKPKSRALRYQLATLATFRYRRRAGPWGDSVSEMTFMNKMNMRI